MKLFSFTLVLSAFSLSPQAADHVVAQKDTQFAPTSIKIKVGDAVDFRNDDPFSHNVFSLSDAKSFDLGSYPKGESRKVTFEQPGTVDVECAVHPTMQMKIEVEP